MDPGPAGLVAQHRLGAGYDLTTGEGCGYGPSASSGPRDTPRLGQASFRLAVVDAYNGAYGVRVALVEVRTGKGAVLDLVESIRQLAAQRPIAQVVFNPMRFEGEWRRMRPSLLGETQAVTPR